MKIVTAVSRQLIQLLFTLISSFLRFSILELAARADRQVDRRTGKASNMRPASIAA